MRRLLVGVLVLALGVTGCCFFGDRPGGPRSEVVRRPANLTPAGDFIFLDVAVVERPYGDHFLDQEVWEGGDEQGYLETKPLLEENGLRVCQLDLGQAGSDGPATIVCGAPNVQATQLVAVATPGARMPDGTRLRRAKLRGVVENDDSTTNYNGTFTFSTIQAYQTAQGIEHFTPHARQDVNQWVGPN